MTDRRNTEGVPVDDDDIPLWVGKLERALFGIQVVLDKYLPKDVIVLAQFKGVWYHYLCSKCGLAFKQDRPGHDGSGVSASCPRCGSLKIEPVIKGQIEVDGALDPDAPNTR